MENTQQSNEAKQETKTSSTNVTQPRTPAPEQPVALPETSKAEGQPKQTEPTVVRLVEAVPLHVVETDDLKPFETQTLDLARQTLEISRKTYRVAWFALGAALAGAVFVWSQVRVMSYQTQIMASQAESDAAGGSLAAIQVQKQVVAAQQQAKAAQDGVEAIKRQTRQDQRAWIKIEMPEVPELPEGKQAFAKIVITNLGETAARNVIAEIVVQPRKRESPPVIRFAGIPRRRITMGVLFPNQPFPTVVFLKQALSRQDLENWEGGVFYFLVYARTQYEDIFGVHHVTTFCSTFVGSKTEVYLPTKNCSDYNGVDNN